MIHMVYSRCIIVVICSLHTFSRTEIYMLKTYAYLMLFYFFSSDPLKRSYLIQDFFDEFDDVDELYSSLPLDKVESLEDLVTIGPPAKVFSNPSEIT